MQRPAAIGEPPDFFLLDLHHRQHEAPIRLIRVQEEVFGQPPVFRECALDVDDHGRIRDECPRERRQLVVERHRLVDRQDMDAARGPGIAEVHVSSPCHAAQSVGSSAEPRCWRARWSARHTKTAATISAIESRFTSQPPRRS